MPEQPKTQHILVKDYRSTDRLMVAAPMPGLEPEDLLVEVMPTGHLLLQGNPRGVLKDIIDPVIPFPGQIIVFSFCTPERLSQKMRQTHNKEKQV